MLKHISYAKQNTNIIFTPNLIHINEHNTIYII